MQQINLFATSDTEPSFGAICDRLGCQRNAPAWPDQFGMALHAWLSAHACRPIRTLSLFSGAGGLDIGFSDAGFDIVSAVEVEQKFCDTLELNTGTGKRFPTSTVSCVDIRTFYGQHIGKIDFIIGGPPCQTFSAAGRRANGVLGTTDARGVLFREYVRLLQALSPKGFLFENVYGIIGAQGGQAWSEILQAFSEIGYKLYYRILDAADYGVPQHRERLIIVGLKEGQFKFPRPTHGPDSIDATAFYPAQLAIEGVISNEEAGASSIGGRYAHLLADIPPGLNYSFYTEELGHPKPIFAWRSKFSDFLYKADPNTPVRTIKASGGAYTGPLHWDNRFFKLEEYKRLQTFPDDYIISGSKQIAVKQIGNSVPPQLARIMAIAIRQQVFQTEFPFQLSVLDDCEALSFRKRKRQLSDIYQKKAALAIQAIQDTSVITPQTHGYHCLLDSNFKYTEVPSEQANFSVQVRWETDLFIDVYDTHAKSDKVFIEISITASDHKWCIGVERVILLIHTQQPKGFTAAWKAFEHELRSNAIKADLVQLNGYYQYQPNLFCTCQVNSNIPYGDMIQAVVTENCIPRILTSTQLSSKWGIPESKLMEVAEYLKLLGYEVRNHSTNPQIDEGCWLIPYAFPTLTPLSVQLRKTLRRKEQENGAKTP